MIYVERKIINLNRKIDLDEWNRFEELADAEPSIWETFWTISEDKTEVEENKICRNFYYSKVVLQMLHRPMTQLVGKNKITKDDIEIIFSLFNKMVPKYECEDCECMSIE
tara:strand:+ start:28 stop:357 length:330 start_codon:yes stop_codon:yes gene_type:complete